MRKIEYLVLHTTAGNRNWSAGQVQDYFLKEKKWKVGGYHWLIEMSGEAKRLYEDKQVTNGVLPFTASGIAIRNVNSLHISWIGGIDGAGNVLDNRTVMQKAAQTELIHAYIRLYPDILILGHNQVARKACPCFFVPDFCRSILVPEQNIYTSAHFGIFQAHS